MKKMSKTLFCTAAIALSSILVPTASHAQDVIFAEPDGVREYDRVDEVFEDTFFSHDQNAYDNRSIFRQFTSIFGLGFTENEIAKDGEAINELYVGLLEQQFSTTPRVRTPDLVSPYETSLTLTPLSEIGAREFEDLGFRQPLPAPARPPAFVAPAPIPALW
ncbi:MAG: hypothetical protein AAGA75_23865 [Cyanobacteria bacterium P01_E01_bin.6]